MKDKIMSFEEIDNYIRNLEMLEARLGYEVPKNLLNSNDMGKEIMSLNEIDTTARNIELITGSRYDPPKGSLNYYICKGIDGLYILFGMLILLWMVVDYIRMYLFM